MTRQEMENTLKQRAEYIRMREELDAMIEQCTDAVKAAMDAENLTETTAGPFKVVWKEVKRETLDSKALKAAAPDVWKLYSKTTTTRPFTVK